MVYTKMQDILDDFASHGKRVFGINDVARIAGKPRSYVSKMLAANKKVKRIERGKYCLAGSSGADIYEIASQIVFPSYISMFAAFQFYSITEQSVLRYSVMTIKRHRPVAVGENAIEFITIGKERFFGYKKTGEIYIALVEKAIIDALYMGSPPISYIEDAFSEAMRRNMIDENRLVDFALKMRSKTVARKVSKLLKANGTIPRGLSAV